MSTTHIFLSPHLDDAVFSCGGTIAALTGAGEAVCVVTVTTASPRLDRLPESARALHSLWGLPGDVVAARRGEDRAAADLLGFVPIHLEFLDAIYRTDRRGRYLYPTRDSLFPRGRWRKERELAARLAERLSEITDVRRSMASHERSVLSQIDGTSGGNGRGNNVNSRPLAPPGSHGQECTFYAPLALGNHVDHQLLRTAVRLAGLNPIWYEDFPYLGSEPDLSSGDAHAALRRVTRLVGVPQNGLRPLLIPFDPASRVKAMRVYRSQLGTVFGSEEEMVGDVGRLFPRTADGRPAERLWHPAGP